MVSFLTDTVVCGFSLYHILAYFLIYSCIGWCLEASMPPPPPVSW